MKFYEKCPHCAVLNPVPTELRLRSSGRVRGVCRVRIGGEKVVWIGCLKEFIWVREGSSITTRPLKKEEPKMPVVQRHDVQVRRPRIDLFAEARYLLATNAIN